MITCQSQFKMEFIEKYTRVDDGNSAIMDQEVCDLNQLDKEFFDDSFIEQLAYCTDYGALRNVTRPTEKAQNLAFDESDVANFLNEDVDAEHYQLNFLEKEYDKFDKYKDRIDKSKTEVCMHHLKDDKNYFYYAPLYAIRFHFTEKKNPCSKGEIRNDISGDLCKRIHNLRKS